MDGFYGWFDMDGYGRMVLYGWMWMDKKSDLGEWKWCMMCMEGELWRRRGG